MTLWILFGHTQASGISLWRHKLRPSPQQVAKLSSNLRRVYFVVISCILFYYLFVY